MPGVEQANSLVERLPFQLRVIGINEIQEGIRRLKPVLNRARLLRRLIVCELDEVVRRKVDRSDLSRFGNSGVEISERL